MSDKQELNKLNEFELLDKLSSMIGAQSTAADTQANPLDAPC